MSEEQGYDVEKGWKRLSEWLNENYGDEIGPVHNHLGTGVHGGCPACGTEHLSEERIQELADEAERGYDLSRLRRLDAAEVDTGIGLCPSGEKSPQEGPGDPRQSPGPSGS